MEEDRKHSSLFSFMNNLESPATRNLINFNAPLLSTRRPVSTKTLKILPPTSSLLLSREFSTMSNNYNSNVRIPFSWEQTPGKPKNDLHIVVDHSDFLPLPPPPPPPPPKREISNNYDNDEFDRDDDEWDGMDVFSLGQSAVEEETGDDAVEIMFGFEGLEVGSNDNDNDNSPNFIIQRFIPDAKALAAAAAASRGGGGGRRRRRRRRSSSHPDPAAAATITKGCGLNEIFFPWRNIKPKPCGATKNPVVLASPIKNRKKSHDHDDEILQCTTTRTTTDK